MKIRVVVAISIFFFLLPGALLADDNTASSDDVIFKARVVSVIENKKIIRDDGSTSIQQVLELFGLDGPRKNQKVVSDGTAIDVISASEYKAGDTVVVHFSKDADGKDMFYVTDYARENRLLWLALIFALIVTMVGRLKGVRALVVLVLTFIIILKFIIPQILNGTNPLFISIIGCAFILTLAIFLTEGFKKTSTIAVVSILVSLIITGVLSIWFTDVARLTGFASEEAMYLVGLAKNTINIQGLFLAGMIIGALGVLDDVVISQVMLVKELVSANSSLSKKELYNKAMRVGVSHLSSMVNTLFLAYAGASLPLLLLFSIKEPPFLTFSQVVNHEVIATEIVRTLAGSVGLVLAVPIATLLAVHWIARKNPAEKRVAS